MLITWWRKERNARASRVNEGDGLSSRTFYKTPLGAGSHTIPIVQTANILLVMFSKKSGRGNA